MSWRLTASLSFSALIMASSACFPFLSVSLLCDLSGYEIWSSLLLQESIAISVIPIKRVERVIAGDHYALPQLVHHRPDLPFTLVVPFDQLREISRIWRKIFNEMSKV